MTQIFPAFIPGPLLRVNMGVKQWIIIGDRYLANEILKLKGSITSGRPYHLFAFKYYALDQRYCYVSRLIIYLTTSLPFLLLLLMLTGTVMLPGNKHVTIILGG